MALRKKKHDTHLNRKRRIEHTGFYPYLAQYLEISKVQNTAEQTLKRRDSALRRFIEWCDERSLSDPKEITKPILERYQKYLYYYRKSDGQPLSVGSQHVFLTPLKSWFKWLTRENFLLYNPASELVLPKKPKRLPRAILSIEEVQQVLALPNTDSISGLRDRAILEILYATGIRRAELTNLEDCDIDHSRRALLVREGKNNKDRYLPLGDSAAHWVARYQQEARGKLLYSHSQRTLFLTDYGEAFSGSYLGHHIKRYLQQAGIDKTGSCHLFRHAMATRMLENGADIRFIQAMLGHTDLSTTEIYTRVSIEKLQQIHAATHPANRADKEKLLADLEAEEVEES